MIEVTHAAVRIGGGFWGARLALNATTTIAHQWAMLEQTGCIENFRIAAGRSTAFRQGYFFADSDAYKWLEAACRIHAATPDPVLLERINELADLIRAVQMPDGYIFTYNQIHFPGRRWVNLPLEHELYCLGHLIEACISHYEAFGNDDLLSVARRVADLLVRDFMDAGPARVSGHEEIELALVRLHRVTGEPRYFELARNFVARRGRDRWVMLHHAHALWSTGRRIQAVEEARKGYREAHGAAGLAQLPPGIPQPNPRAAWLRFTAGVVAGGYMQADRPVAARREPVGHAVRFGYLQTAAAMLARGGAGDDWRAALAESWDVMVQRRMAVTGGVGSNPAIEGYGGDYDLDPEHSYNETCAALSAMLWSHEMGMLTGEPKYADLIEWQLYNASLVGLSEHGDAYSYNNPLRCAGKAARRPWFLVPCCPTNLARIWARLGDYVYALDGDALVVNQFVTSRMQEDPHLPVSVRVTSGLPWEGRVRMEVQGVRARAGARENARLRFRVPSWAAGFRVTRNGEAAAVREVRAGETVKTAGGYSPYGAKMVEIAEALAVADVIEIGFDMPVRVLRPDPRVGPAALGLTLTRGPLVYCLESADNPGLDVMTAKVDVLSVSAVWEPELFGGVMVLRGQTVDGRPFTAIPYYCWGNRGESQVNVVLK